MIKSGEITWDEVCESVRKLGEMAGLVFHYIIELAGWHL